MKQWSILLIGLVAVAAMAVMNLQSPAQAEEGSGAQTTITGKTACAQCDKIAKGHDIALVTENGVAFVLKGKGDDYKEVHKVRKDGKKAQAVIVGEIRPMKNDAGDPYFEADVASIKIVE